MTKEEWIKQQTQSAIKEINQIFREPLTNRQEYLMVEVLANLMESTWKEAEKVPEERPQRRQRPRLH